MIIITNCFVHNNVFAQDILNGRNKNIQMDLEIVASNECVEHEYEGKNEKETTCSIEGFNIFKCINCSYSYKETIFAGHKYTPTTIDATCIEEGYTLYICDYCNDSYKDHYTPVRAHQYMPDIKKEATCEEEGVIEYRCIYCDDFYEEIILAVGHDYKETVVEATCSEEGYTLHPCKKCNCSYKDHFTPVRAHQYMSDIKKEAACEEEGVIEYRCIYCNDFYEEVILALGHDYKEIVVEATCSEEGYTLHTCKYCNRSYKDHYTPVKAHQYISYIKKEAAFKEEGVKEYRCIYCDDFYEVTIPALGHEYGDWFLQKEATSIEKGYYTAGNIKEVTEEAKNTSESISESEDSSEVKDTAENSESAAQLPEAEAPADIVPEKSIQTASDISPPPATINAMDVFLTALIALVSIGLATAIIGDMRVLNWDRKQRIKHHK